MFKVPSDVSIWTCIASVQLFVHESIVTLAVIMKFIWHFIWKGVNGGVDGGKKYEVSNPWRVEYL